MTSPSLNFQELYARYYNMVLQLVKYNHGTEEEAPEIFQEALILYFEIVRDGKVGEKTPEKTWIYSLARSQWFKRLRTRGKEIHFHDAEDFVEVKEEFDEDARKEMLRADGYFQALDKNSAQLLIEVFYKRTNRSVDKNVSFSALQDLKNSVLQKKETVLGPDDMLLIDQYLRYELRGQELTAFQDRVKADNVYGERVREFVKALFAAEAMGRREISLLLGKAHAELNASDGFEKYDPLFEYVVKRHRLSRGNIQLILLFIIFIGGSTYMYLNGYFKMENLPKILRPKNSANEIFDVTQPIFDTFRNSKNEIDSIVVRRELRSASFDSTFGH